MHPQENLENSALMCLLNLITILSQLKKVSGHHQSSSYDLHCVIPSVTYACAILVHHVIVYTVAVSNILSF